MVVGAFPIVKLGSLLMKQISKPIANFVKERAKNHPFFRTYVCMPPAQFYNWCEIQTKMWIMNLGKPVNIPTLNEAMAIELGANLLGEGIVFFIAAGMLVSEYNRQVKKETVKEEARKEEINNLLHQLQELYFQVERQDTQIRELMREIGEIDRKRSLLGIFHKPKDGSPPPHTKPEVKDTAPDTPKPVQIENVTDIDSKTLNLGLILQVAQEMEDNFLGNNAAHDANVGLVDNALLFIEKEVLCRGSVV